MDAALLKTQHGYLLVSPDHAVFCPIFPDEHDIVLAYIKDSCTELPIELKQRLDEHGFFSGPRPMRPPHHLLQFQVTNACNLRCAYCSAESGCARTHELTLDDVKSTIDDVTSIFPNIDISFTGGEPLIVPWLFEAMDYARTKTKKIGLLSNLLLLKNNDVLFDKIVRELKLGTTIQVSISGTDKEVCNRLSGRACYDDIIEIINRLNQAGVLPDIDVMMSAPDSRKNIEGFANFRRSIPEPARISIGLIYPCGREHGEHIFTSRDETEAMLDDVAFEGGVSIPGPKCETVTHRRNACSCVENENIFVRSDGNIFSCFKMVECFGNIHDGIKTVLEKRRKSAVMAAELPLCKDCPFVHLCASGCRADNIILTGNTKAPICGPWRQKLLAEMLFENKPFVLDWSIPEQMTEARKRGFNPPDFVITSLKTSVL